MQKGIVKMYYFSMVLVIIATVLYNICQKSINDNVNPVISMTATYTVALILSVIVLIFSSNKSIMASFKDLNWASYMLGVVIFLLEIGFLLVYRSGWSIDVAPLFSNVVTTIVLLFFGIYIFKQQLCFTKVIGIIISIIGLIIMRI